MYTPGQGSVLHDLFSGDPDLTYGGQGLPPCCGCCVMIGNRLSVPSPQVLLHCSYSPHCHSQYTIQSRCFVTSCFSYFLLIYIPGQGCFWHSLTSLWYAEYCTRPELSTAWYFLCLACLPPSQVLLHWVQGPQSSKFVNKSTIPSLLEKKVSYCEHSIHWRNSLP